MHVIKRNGKRETIYYDKISARNMKLAADLQIDSISLSQDVIRGLKSGMTTCEIDHLSCENAIARSAYEPDYATLAVRIAVNDLHKNTPSTFLECITKLNKNLNPKGQRKPLISDAILKFATEHNVRIQQEIDCERDYNFGYFGVCTLKKGYLQEHEHKTVERPQYMWMRVALGIHGPYYNKRLKKHIAGNIDKVIESYHIYSFFKLTQATPTLFHAGAEWANLSSCFVLTCEDSIEGWTESWRDCAYISKAAGGIGIDLTPVREDGAYIGGTGGQSTGIIPLVIIYNDIARAVNQDGKRKGAIALSLQPWHPDLFDFLEIRNNAGDEKRRARDVFPALWIPDLFFKRLKIEGAMWSFFSPGTYPELITLYGQEWEDRYIQLETEKKYVREPVLISKVWEAILDSIMENGLPYMLSKDNVNKKSNQKNIGPITNTNLCTEIMEYHTGDSIASCNLASICLPSCVDRDRKVFDFHELGRIAEIGTENLNNVIDRNYVPTEKALDNNLDYRPIGLGIQGLAEVFSALKMTWETDDALILNQLIFEYIYFHALSRSCYLASIDGPHKDFATSPAAQGILQYDMWGVIPLTTTDAYYKKFGANKLDWENLKMMIKKQGLRNSLLIAPMPTGTTSQIMGNTESFQPRNSNIFMRKVLAGDYPMPNMDLYRDLKELGLWNKEFVDDLIEHGGSVQNIPYIPADIKARYKTIWEISQKWLVKMAAARGAFIDQSQSMNIFMARPSVARLSTLYMDAWELGLKTLSYYVHSKPAQEAVKFSLDREESTNSTSTPKTSRPTTPRSPAKRVRTESIDESVKRTKLVHVSEEDPEEPAIVVPTRKRARPQPVDDDVEEEESNHLPMNFKRKVVNGRVTNLVCDDHSCCT